MRLGIGAPVVWIVLAVATCACAPQPPEAPPEKERIPRRMTDGESRVWTPESAWTGSKARWVELPHAVNATVYDRDRWAGRQVMVDLGEDGTMQGHGRADTPNARASLADAGRRLESPPDAPPPAMIRATRRTSWQDVAAALIALTSGGIATERIRFDLGSWWADGEWLELRRLPESPGEPSPVQCTLSRNRGGTDGWTRIDVPMLRMEFPRDKGLTEWWTRRQREFYDVVWWKVQERLTDIRGPTRSATIRIDETDGPVYFAYVVSLLDVLIDAGYRTVVFPDLALAFRVEPPPPPPEYHPTTTIPDWTLPVSALAAAIALAATFASIGRKRVRREPSPPRRKP